jgi:hypothetical protein
MLPVAALGADWSLQGSVHGGLAGAEDVERFDIEKI